MFFLVRRRLENAAKYAPSPAYVLYRRKAGRTASLHVQSLPTGIEHRLFHHFRKGRVWEHGMHEFFFRCLEIS